MDKIYVTDVAERVLLREQRKVVINGEIDSDVAHDFIVDMAILSDVEKSDVDVPITVIISSEGGNAEYGNSCIRAIKEAQEKGLVVIGSVYGQAMSMAFFILQVCDQRVMGEFDVIMAHGVSATSVGDMKSREAEDKLLKFYQNKYAELIAKRCKKYSVSWWKKLLTDSTPKFFTSSESLELGLVDRIE